MADGGSRVTRIEHDGVPILYQDFRGLQRVEDAQAAFEQSRAAVLAAAAGGVLILTDFTGSRFNAQMVEAAKALAAQNKPYVKASALVGLSGLQTVLFTGVNQSAEREIQWFNDVDSAKQWLVQQQQR